MAQSVTTKLPTFRPDLRLRLVAAIVRALGPRRCRAILAASKKSRGLSIYDRAAATGHVMSTHVQDNGGRHRGGGGGALRLAPFPLGARMLPIGGIARAATFGIGSALGVSAA